MTWVVQWDLLTVVKIGALFSGHAITVTELRASTMAETVPKLRAEEGGLFKLLVVAQRRLATISAWSWTREYTLRGGYIMQVEETLL